MTDIPVGPYQTARPVPGGWTILTRDGGLLGRVAWYARWSRYEFLPAPGSGYSSDCMRATAAFWTRGQQNGRG